MLTFHKCSYKYSYMTLAGCSIGFHHTQPYKKEKQQQMSGQRNVLNNPSLALALISLSLQPENQWASSAALLRHAAWGDWGRCCCPLAPSCGAVQGDLLHLAQLCQQPFHAVFELRQTGQRFRRLQLPGVVQPALQHWGGRAEEEPEVSTWLHMKGFLLSPQRECFGMLDQQSSHCHTC